MVDFPREVNALFTSRHGDGKNLSKTQVMNLRHDVAKSMLSGGYSHHVNAMEKKSKAQHDEDVKKWSLILDDISLADNVDQYVFLSIFLDVVDLRFISTRARDTLFDAVYPLLQAIGSYAGCCVSLIAGNAPKDDTDKGFFTA